MQIEGLHHVTAMTADPRTNNGFFTGTLGLRRVKKTVNFDAPDAYHLYYGNGSGLPGTVMTYFGFPSIGRRTRGAGEVATTLFSVPEDTLEFWQARLADAGVEGLARESRFGLERLSFTGPDGDEFALVAHEDERRPWDGGVSQETAIRGLHGVAMRVADPPATERLLQLMGYEVADRKGPVTHLRRLGGNGADLIELEAVPNDRRATLGAGSVHHVAFAVPDRAAQLAVRRRLIDAGLEVTPVIDRDYFWAIYFRTPGGVLFEVATNEPGFDCDEDPAHLGETLQLPSQHAHLRAYLEEHLPALD